MENVMKIKKRKYNLHRSNNFTLPYKGLFLEWNFQMLKYSPRILINEIPFTDYLTIFNIQTIREEIRNTLPITKNQNRLFNLERMVSKEQLAVMDFFPNITETLLNSTMNNLKLKIQFEFKNPPKKVKVIEYYYEIPTSLSKPVGESIDITPEMLNIPQTK